MAKKVDLGVPGEPVGKFIEEFCTKPYNDEDGVQVASGIGRDGKEYGDPVPMAPPVGYSAPPDLMSMIKQMVHNEQFNRMLDEQDWDTFEEAGDFDVEDDPGDPLTAHELLFYPPDERAAASGPPAAPAPLPSDPAKAAEGGATPAPPPSAAEPLVPAKSSTST